MLVAQARGVVVILERCGQFLDICGNERWQEFADRQYIGYEINKGFKDDSKVFRLSERKDGWNCDGLKCGRLWEEGKSEKGGQNWNGMESEVKVFFKMKETQRLSENWGERFSWVSLLWGCRRTRTQISTAKKLWMKRWKVGSTSMKGRLGYFCEHTPHLSCYQNHHFLNSLYSL